MTSLPAIDPVGRGARRLVLASASPRRTDILRAAGYLFEATSSGVDERSDPVSSPCETAVSVAKDKALAVHRRAADSVVIGADTVVVAGGELLGKPASPEDARRMLLGLRGRRHRVITGVCVVSGTTVNTGFETTEVSFRSYASLEIDEYLATGLPFDRAGAYGIQDVPFSPVESFEGCYLNVVGLPMCVAGGLLKDFGIEPANGRVGCAGHTDRVD